MLRFLKKKKTFLNNFYKQACFFVSALTLLILISSSFNSLEANEYGLDYSSLSKSVKTYKSKHTFSTSKNKIGKKPYTSGIHFLGIGHRFIKFPKTVLNLEYSNHEGADFGPIKSRTSDGLEVVLEISF